MQRKQLFSSKYLAELSIRYPVSVIRDPYSNKPLYLSLPLTMNSDEHS